MLTFPKYGSYKTSGISWIPDIPASWDTERAKWLFEKMGRAVRPKDDVVTAFRDGEVTLRKNRRTEGFTNALQEHGYQGIRKGDLVIHAMDAFAGAIGVSDSEGKSTPVYSVCVPSGEFYVNSYYYAYLLRYMSQAGYIQALAKGIRERSSDFRFNDFANLFLPIPSQEEQDRIVAFLDEKTREIDDAIAKKQRLIELLQEQKAILINDAVTKGLDPDVPMRESGVEWIGRVPAHWSQVKLKYLVTFVSGGTPSKDNAGFWQGDIPWVSPKDMKQHYLHDSIDSITNKALEKTSLKLIDDGAVLIVVRGMILARKIPIALASVPLTINQDMKAMLPSKDCLPEYLLYFLDGVNAPLSALLEESGHGTKALPTEKLGGFTFFLPRKEEQNVIVEHIKEVNREFVGAISFAERQIQLLHELKQLVISSAVTGKIKI